MGKQRNRFDTSKETPENQQQLASGGKKKFSVHDMIRYTPLTGPQNKLWDAYNRGCEVIIQVGPAGTGKTASAIWNVMNEYLSDQTAYDGIVLLRTPVATTEMGFMPGDESEKDAYYEGAFVEAVDAMFKFNSTYNNLKALGIITFKTTANLRGINLKRKLVVVDEFQSADIHTLKTVFTRIGKGSKIIFCGDFNQNDLRHKKGSQQSGFHDFMKIINAVADTQEHDIELIEYAPKDVVRSGIVRAFIIAAHELGI